MKKLLAWVALGLSLALVCPSFAYAQDEAPTLPEGDSWFAVGWRTWCGVAGIAIVVIPFVTNTLEPMIRDRWPVLASKIRQWGPLTARLFMARTMRDALTLAGEAYQRAIDPSIAGNTGVVDTGDVRIAVTVKPVTPTTDAGKTPVEGSNRPPSPNSGPMMRLVFLTLALACGACAGGLPREVSDPLERMSLVIGPASDATLALYERDLAACPDEACAERVKVRYAPIRDAFAAVRDVWCAVKPEACK